MRIGVFQRGDMWLGLAAVFLVVALLVYGPSLRYGFVNFDDNVLVTENPAVQNISLQSLRTVFTQFDPELYIPLTFVSYQWDYFLGRGSAFPFHLQNLLLHVANALLVTAMLMALLRTKSMGVLLGLVFLVHPLHSEVVTWISGRKDLLATFFSLLSMLAYLCYREQADRRWYALSMFFFLLALLSKAVVLTLPVLLLCIDWLQRRALDRHALREKWPYLLLSLIFAIVAWYGKTDVLQNSDAFTGMAMAAKAALFYCQKFVWPTSLSVLYPYPDPVHVLHADIFLALFFSLGLLVVAGASLRRRPQLSFGILLFFIALSPTFLSFTRAGDVYFAADRYAYFPSLGLLYLLGYALLRLPRVLPVLRIGVVCLFLVALGLASRERARVWQSTQALFSDAVIKYPSSYLAQAKVGAGFRDLHEPERAREHLQKSIRLKPNPRAYFNLGLLAIDRNDVRAAIEANERTIATDATYASAYVNLGFLYWQSKRFDEAIVVLQRAIALEPHAVDARLNLAGIYRERGKHEKVRHLAQEVLNIDPANKDALGLLR